MRSPHWFNLFRRLETKKERKRHPNSDWKDYESKSTGLWNMSAHVHRRGLRNGMILPMEYVDHDGPSVELVDRHVRLLREANVRLHHDGCIGQRDGGSFFHDSGLLDLGLNSMHIRVALAHDSKRGECWRKNWLWVLWILRFKALLVVSRTDIK